ncbi:hypothetical protein TNIN_64881 [Trichonephila inaurata madagascariensis]|uniref:Uncharacterized protein n=1 Tax=Trichonephila inaurata madagascariensis TaxID=2747483 RepID=A0A8X6YPN3_9ARAC|nr:hypothetical protein TNIN_64881 [Trichonephila inaurata madagascariensis]
MDFLQKVGNVLNLKHSKRLKEIVKEEILQEVQIPPSLEENICLLRDKKDKYLTKFSIKQRKGLLPFVEHRINTVISLIGSSSPSGLSRMDIPVIPAFPEPPEAIDQNQDSTCLTMPRKSPLLSRKNRSPSPANFTNCQA